MICADSSAWNGIEAAELVKIKELKKCGIISFEDSLRTAISLGGDSDTIAATPAQSLRPSMVCRRR